MTERHDPQDDFQAPQPIPAQPVPPQEGAMQYGQSLGLAAANDEEKTNGMLCHALAFVGIAIPFGNILGPLV